MLPYCSFLALAQVLAEEGKEGMEETEEEEDMEDMEDMDSLVALEGMEGKLVLNTYQRRRTYSRSF